MRKPARSLFVMFLIVVFFRAVQAELLECIDHAPQTYHDNEILDHTQKCLSMPSKYEISYR